MRREFVWEFCTGEVEMPVQVEKSPAPWPGGSGQGGRSQPANMRLISKTYQSQMRKSVSRQAPRTASPKFGEVSPQATEGLYYRTSRK